MDALYHMIVSLIFLGTAIWLLNRNRYARYMMKPMGRFSWALTKKLFGFAGKLLRKVASLVDPY